MRKIFKVGARLFFSGEFAGIWGALWLMVPSLALAFEGEERQLTVMAESNYGVSLLVEYDVKWKIDTLLGEPTRNLNIRWRLPEQSELKLNGVSKFGDLPNDIRISELPPEIRDTIRLYDVNVQVGFFDAPVTTQVLANGYVNFDAGAPATEGDEWSFNVAGSPGWSDFMTRNNGHPLSEADAKSVMTSRELYGDVQERNVTAKIALGDVLRWLSKEANKKTVWAMINAADSQVAVLEETLGLPVDEMMADLNRLSAELDAAVDIGAISRMRQELQEDLAQLAIGVPRSYVPANKAGEYDAAKASIAASLDHLLILLVPDESVLNAEERAYQDWLKRQKAAVAAKAAEMAAIAAMRTEPELEFPYGRVQVSDQNCIRDTQLREYSPAVNNYQADSSSVRFGGLHLRGFKPGGRTKGEARDAQEGDNWVIAPRYIHARDFNDDGIAVVTILLSRECRFSRDEEEDVWVLKFFDVAINHDEQQQFCVKKRYDSYNRMDEFGRMHKGSDGPYTYRVGSPCDQ